MTRNELLDLTSLAWSLTSPCIYDSFTLSACGPKICARKVSPAGSVVPALEKSMIERVENTNGSLFAYL